MMFSPPGELPWGPARRGSAAGEHSWAQKGHLTAAELLAEIWMWAQKHLTLILGRSGEEL